MSRSPSARLSNSTARVADGTLDILGDPLPAERQAGPDVRDVLGRPARPFAQWAARDLPAFR
ncbi:hypothetical protein [Streptomyces sennicomposti]